MCQVSFVPTFEVHDEFLVEHDEPGTTVLCDDDDLLFIFILDRSGSMGGPRMEAAKDAVLTFLKGLPAGCSFAVINFGDKHEAMKTCHTQPGPIFKYNNDVFKAAETKIKKY